MRCKRTTLIRSIMTLGIVFLAGACVSEGPKPSANLEDLVKREELARQQSDQLNQKIFSVVDSSSQPQDFVIGDGDLLSITVFDAPELQTDARVESQGSITLPLLGAVQVKGLTIRQAERSIELAYNRQYLENSHVKILIKENLSGKITILGSVVKPGTYDYLSRQRIMDALALAGGLSDKSGSLVELRRPGEDPAHPIVLLMDLDEMVKGRPDLNVEIQRGDVLFVPQAGVVYVDGAVHVSGSHPIRRDMTVQEVITAAGGFSSVADARNIKLIRYVGDGKREVVRFGEKDAANGASVLNTQVKDRDIVFVETSGYKSFVYGLHIYGLYGGLGYSPPAR
jgi:polysaccharide biosynthesis/export protein